MDTHFAYVWGGRQPDATDTLEHLLEGILKYPQDRHVYHGGPEFGLGSLTHEDKLNQENGNHHFRKEDYTTNTGFMEKLSQVNQLCDQTPGLRDRIIALWGCHPKPVINRLGNDIRYDLITRPEFSGLFGHTDHIWNYLFWYNIRTHERQVQKLHDMSLGKLMKTVPTKLFSCAQHLPHPHRYAVMQVLMDTGLIDRGLISWCNSESAWNNFCSELQHEMLNRHSDVCQRILRHSRKFFPEPYYQDTCTKTNENREQMSKNSMMRGYENCLFDIVVESSWIANFYTEKTFKALFWGKPFVILGAPEQNRMLRGLGFETFDEYFDLTESLDFDLSVVCGKTSRSYDLEVSRSSSGTPTNPNNATEICNRYEQILKPLTQISDSEIPEIFKNVRPKITHNHDVLIKHFFDDTMFPEYIWHPKQRDYQKNVTYLSDMHIHQVRSDLRAHSYFGQFCP